jgi:hypothetical protein
MNSGGNEKKAITLSFLLVIAVCVFFYWFARSSVNEDCISEADGTIDCR